MEVGFWVTVFLGETEINHVDLIASLADTHEEIVWLDISVDERLGVDVLDSGDELIGQQKDCLEGELAVTEIEQIFQTGTKKVKNHGVVITLCTEPTDKGNADTSCEGFVDASLIFELRVFSFDRFEFDGNFFAGNDVCS